MPHRAWVEGCGCVRGWMGEGGRREARSGAPSSSCSLPPHTRLHSPHPTPPALNLTIGRADGEPPHVVLPPCAIAVLGCLVHNLIESRVGGWEECVCVCVEGGWLQTCASTISPPTPLPHTLAHWPGRMLGRCSLQTGSRQWGCTPLPPPPPQNPLCPALCVGMWGGGGAEAAAAGTPTHVPPHSPPTCSERGVLNTRSRPNRSSSPTEQRNTPPNATSSPNTSVLRGVGGWSEPVAACELLLVCAQPAATQAERLPGVCLHGQVQRLVHSVAQVDRPPGGHCCSCC